jgi:hypothetical protein
MKLSIGLYGFIVNHICISYVVHFWAIILKPILYEHDFRREKNGNKEYYYIAFISNQVKKVGAANFKL